jgi:hypothetical protein
MPSAPEPLPLFQALDVSLWDDSTRRDPQIPTVWIEPDLPVEEVDQVVAACLAADDTPQRVARLNPGPS